MERGLQNGTLPTEVLAPSSKVFVDQSSVVLCDIALITINDLGCLQGQNASLP